MYRRVNLLTGVLLCFYLFAGGAWSVEAREAAGGGVFLDLSGCLAASPCSNTVVLFPQLRLILGDGLLVAHLELINLFEIL